ncbi:MAG: SdiA-regulated domain-containing protein [Bacteroidota bacterium]
MRNLVFFLAYFDLMRYYFLCFIGILFSSQILAQGPYHFPYDLSRPQLIGELDKDLEEVSGLSLSGNELLAVQDEDGIIFRLNAQTGEIETTIDFGDEGDYEGIEHVGEYVYVTKSSGTLYRVSRAGTPDQQVDKFNGFLNGDNDVEGLAYDRINNRLLLACKAPDVSPETRHIYAFDLTTQTFLTEPILVVAKEEMQAYLASCQPTAEHAAICDFFASEEAFRLGPSALAIHPQTGQYYLTSSRGKLMVVLSPSGRIQHVFRLEKDYFPQPEGLAFAPNGDLYVSTEAKGGEPARIWKLAMVK